MCVCACVSSCAYVCDVCGYVLVFVLPKYLSG